MVNSVAVSQDSLFKEEIIGKWDMQIEFHGNFLIPTIYEFGEDNAFKELRELKCSDSLQPISIGKYFVTDSTLILDYETNQSGVKIKVRVLSLIPFFVEDKYYGKVISSLESMHEFPNSETYARNTTHLYFKKRVDINRIKKFCIEKNIEWLNNSIKGEPSRNLLFDESSIYFGTMANKITKIDAYTGETIWVSNIPFGRNGFFHPLSADDDYFYCLGTQENIYKGSKKNGEIIWTYLAKFDDDVPNKITIFQDLLLVNPSDNKFIAINKSGNLTWSTELESPVVSYTVNKDIIYGHLQNGNFIKINAVNGEVLNKARVFNPRRIYYEPAIINQTLLMTNSQDSLIGIDINSSKVKWVNHLDTINHFSRAGEIVLATSKHKLYRISPETGTTLWSIPLKTYDWIQTVYYDKAIYLQNSGNNFLIINPENGEILFSSPFYYKSFTLPIVTKKSIYTGFYNGISKFKNPTYAIQTEKEE